MKEQVELLKQKYLKKNTSKAASPKPTDLIPSINQPNITQNTLEASKHAHQTQ